MNMKKIRETIVLTLVICTLYSCFTPKNLYAGLIGPTHTASELYSANQQRKAEERGDLAAAARYEMEAKSNGVALAEGMGVLRNRSERCTQEDNKCLPYCKYETVTTCFVCPIFAAVFNTVNEITAKALKNYSAAVAKVVVVAFGIWLAIQILSFAASIETKDLKNLAQAIITQGFVVMLVVAILHTGINNFFSAFIEPVYLTGLKAAQSAVLNNGEGSEEYKITVCPEGDKCIDTKEDLIDESITDGFPVAIGKSVIQTMTILENYVRKFKALGSSFMCEAWKQGWVIFPVLIYWITGFVIWVLCWILIIALPFLMVDSVFQLGVAGALMAPAVGAYAFKSTRAYTKKVWETILNSMFAFVFISVVTMLVLVVLKQSLTEGITNISGGPDVFYSWFNEETYQKADLGKMLESFSWSRIHFVKLVFVFILAWTTLMMAKEFAGELAGSISNTKIGSNIGTMAASSVKGAAVKAGKPLAERGAQKMTSGAIKGVKKGVGSVKHGATKFKMWRSKKKMAKSADGTWTDKSGYKHFSKDGAEYMTKKDKNGAEITKIRTGDVTVTNKTVTRRGPDGKEVKVTTSDLEATGNKFNSIMKANGQVNRDKMKEITRGLSGDTKKQVEAAMAKKMIDQRFAGGKFSQNMTAENMKVDYDADGNMQSVSMKRITDKGEVVFDTMSFNDHGFMETSRTIVGKDGKVTQLSTDGMRTKMVEGKLRPGTDAANMNNAEELDSHVLKDKTLYGYTRYYQDKIDHGARPENIGFDENGNQLGMMSYDEAIGYRDENGKFVTGAFAAFVGQRYGNEFDKIKVKYAFSI